MKKAILMAILSALILSSCGKVEQPTNDSMVTESTSVTTSSAITEVTSTEITDETTISTTTSSEEKKSTTTLKTTENKSKTSTSTKKTTVQATQNTTVENGNQGQNYQPEQTSPPQDIPERSTTTTAKRIVTTTTAKPKPVTTTTARPKPVVTTTTTKKQEEKAEWSELMKAWRVLAENKSPSSSQWELVRQDIVNYGLDKFNGKKDVTCESGYDVSNISFMSPLNLSINTSWTDFSHAHMDSYASPDRSALIKVAQSDKEIYEIVSECRESCKQVVDNGIESWHYFCDINNCLKYASDLEFNVGLDSDDDIWFLTE